MSSKFRLLSTIAILLKFIGVITIIVGVAGMGYGVVEPQQPGHAFGFDDTIAIASGVLFVLSGLLTVAASEVVGVLFAIERNTRANDLPTLGHAQAV